MTEPKPDYEIYRIADELVAATIERIELAKSSGEFVTIIGDDEQAQLDAIAELHERCWKQCAAKLHPSRVGMEYQHKTAEVTVPKHEFQDRDSATERAVKDAESDGWEGRVEDARNHNNLLRRDKYGNEVYRVVFVRWVKQ